MRQRARRGQRSQAKANDGLTEVLWAAYEKSLENAGGNWEQLVYVCYVPPADENGWRPPRASTSCGHGADRRPASPKGAGKRPSTAQGQGRPQEIWPTVV
eukprot:6967742-Prymnesium_polylepis.1